MEIWAIRVKKGFLRLKLYALSRYLIGQKTGEISRVAYSLSNSEHWTNSNKVLLCSYNAPKPYPGEVQDTREGLKNPVQAVQPFLRVQYMGERSLCCGIFSCHKVSVNTRKGQTPAHFRHAEEYARNLKDLPVKNCNTRERLSGNTKIDIFTRESNGYDVRQVFPHLH